MRIKNPNEVEILSIRVSHICKEHKFFCDKFIWKKKTYENKRKDKKEKQHHFNVNK